MDVFNFETLEKIFKEAISKPYITNPIVYILPQWGLDILGVKDGEKKYIDHVEYLYVLDKPCPVLKEKQPNHKIEK